MNSYPGGKNGSGVYQTIINQMPPHTIYIEAFLGAGAIMKAKRPAVASIGIDSDAEVISDWDQNTLPGLTVINGDAISFLKSYSWKGSELVYCDPPYLFETRRSKKPIYNHEMTKADHRRLLAVLKQIPSMVMISGYWSKLYAEELAGWRTETYNTTVRSGDVAEEWLWMNYPEPFELHDYRYLGENFRERERIKRRKLRWKNRLQTMPPLERYAILSEIEELRSRPSS